MFERFTERARQVIVLAREEARQTGGEITTAHLLLGLLREEEGLAARVLASLDVTVEKVRPLAPTGEKQATGQVPFTVDAKTTLELALREALSLGHNYIGTEHILLGLVRNPRVTGAEILLNFGHDSEKVRNGVIRLLGGLKRSFVPSKLVLPALSRETVEWLVDIAGCQPHTHVESAEVYNAALRVLRVNPVERAA